MPAANSLIGDTLPIYASDSPDRAQPMSAAPVSGMMVTSDDANRISNYVALLVVGALLTLILIRIAGLQGMIAVGRSS